MPTPTNRVATALLADQLERSFRGGAWHGPSLSEVLAPVDAAAALMRPIADAHTIWEIVLHAAAWMDIARCRALGETPQVDAGQDWPPLPDTDETAWKETLRQLDSAHRRLHALLLELDDERLGDPVPGSDPTLQGLLFGILQHNTYHAGQISLLAKLATDTGNR